MQSLSPWRSMSQCHLSRTNFFTSIVPIGKIILIANLCNVYFKVFAALLE